jgi:hypothetical protein
VFVMILSIGALGEAIGDDVRATCDRIVLWAGPSP